jgi:hypothetical protein
MHVGFLHHPEPRLLRTPARVQQRREVRPGMDLPDRPPCRLTLAREIHETMPDGRLPSQAQRLTECPRRRRTLTAAPTRRQSPGPGRRLGRDAVQTRVEGDVPRLRDHPSTLLRMTLSLPKGQHRQPFQQLEGPKQQARRTIRPGMPEGQQDVALRRAVEPPSPERRPPRFPSGWAPIETPRTRRQAADGPVRRVARAAR